MSHQDPWERRADNFDKRPVTSTILGISYGAVVTIAIVIVVGLIGVLIWWFSVATSGIKGEGDAEKIKNAAANRIRAQEGFESRFAGIQGADRNIVITAESLRADPESVQLQTELRGQRQICNSLIGDYNAKARSFTAEDFRAADLPKEIDLTNSTTDCKE